MAQLPLLAAENTVLSNPEPGNQLCTSKPLLYVTPTRWVGDLVL